MQRGRKAVSAARAGANPDLGFTADELAFEVASRYARVRKPGGISIAEFARRQGVSPTAAKRALEDARRDGAMTREEHVADPVSGRSCTVYYPVEDGKRPGR